MDLEEWIIKFCRDGDNLEINRNKNEVLIINKRSNVVYALCFKALKDNKKYKDIAKNIESFLRSI